MGVQEFRQLSVRCLPNPFLMVFNLGFSRQLFRARGIVCTPILLTPLLLRILFFNFIYNRNQVAQHDEGTGCKHENEHVGGRGKHGEPKQGACSQQLAHSTE